MLRWFLIYPKPLYMNERNTSVRILYFLGWILIVCALSGVNYCQKDFELGAQTTLSDTPTASPEPTDDNGLITETSTPTRTSAVTATATVAVTRTATAAAAIALQHLMRSATANSDSAISQSGQVYPAPRARLLDGTWLGQIGSERAASEQVQNDSDRDGYSDALETRLGSDPNQAASHPKPPASRVLLRFEGMDDDRDGLSNSDEKLSGTDALKADSDGDAVLDGIEILSGSNPLDAEFFPQDQDGDGLSDALELSTKTNPNSSDSDDDGLRDDLEVIYSANPLDPDSDGDGVSDGKEVAVGSDPTIKDSY